MRSSSILALVSAVRIGFPANARAQSCVSVPLALGGPRPALSIGLADDITATAIFDTGALATTIGLDAAPALGLERSGPLLPPYDRFGAGYQTVLRRLRIGTIELGDVSAPVVPAMLPGYAAIVSPTIFGDRLVTIDLSHARLDVCDRGARALPSGLGDPFGGPPFGLPTIAVKAGSLSVQAHIDTGSPMALAFPMRYAAMLPLSEPLRQIGTARSHAGSAPLYAARIRGDVKIGSLTLDDPEVRFTDVLPEPNIGAPLLARLRITIDSAARRSWAEAVDETTR